MVLLQRCEGILNIGQVEFALDLEAHEMFVVFIHQVLKKLFQFRISWAGYRESDD